LYGGGRGSNEVRAASRCSSAGDGRVRNLEAFVADSDHIEVAIALHAASCANVGLADVGAGDPADDDKDSPLAAVLRAIPPLPKAFDPGVLSPS
jgi:hypothetical protein